MVIFDIDTFNYINQHNYCVIPLSNIDNIGFIDPVKINVGYYSLYANKIKIKGINHIFNNGGLLRSGIFGTCSDVINLANVNDNTFRDSVQTSIVDQKHVFDLLRIKYCLILLTSDVPISDTIKLKLKYTIYECPKSYT